MQLKNTYGRMAADAKKMLNRLLESLPSWTRDIVAGIDNAERGTIVVQYIAAVCSAAGVQRPTERGKARESTAALTALVFY